MQVTIPYARWFECQMYLTHNYIMPLSDYKLTVAREYYTVEFYAYTHYDQFCRRFPAIITPLGD